MLSLFFWNAKITLLSASQDRYAFGHYLPPIDKTQNWFLMSAMQDGGYTELEFSRSFTTCDHENRDLDILVSIKFPDNKCDC